MGIAIIAKGADFSENNIGSVTPASIVNLLGLSISGPSTVTGTEAHFDAVYNPSNTTQRGVTWSVESGSTYASINASSGVLTVLSGASNASVTIKATSNANPSISATKTITVTYQSELTFNELLQYNQASWQKENENLSENPIDGKTYFYLHADDNSKIGSNISTVKGTGNNIGAFQVFKIPVPDGATSVRLFPIKTSQYSGYAFVDNSDVVTGFIYNTTVQSGTAATYSVPAGSKFLYMPLSPSVYTSTNNGADLTVQFS